MDPINAELLANRLMTRHGLFAAGWSFGFNRRKRSLGLCRYEQKRIELSIWFVAANDEAAVRDTVLHEIAHALAGPKAGHGPAWAAVCRRIGAAPTRTCNDAIMPHGPYQATCPSCGQRHSRHRKPIRARTYYCRSCGTKHGKLRFNRCDPSMAPVDPPPIPVVSDS